MPWVRLHAAKDYLAMLRRLEAFPSIHQVFNFVPSLLDQLEDYLPPSNKSDDLLELCRKPAQNITEQDACELIRLGFMAYEERLIRPYPRYHDLLLKRGKAIPHLEELPRVARKFTRQDLLDLQVWCNLAWMDPLLRSQDSRLKQIERKGARFTEEDKTLVLQAQLETIAQVIPAYQQAALRGQVELTTSPYYHPIMPLLCDLQIARKALPHVSLPEVSFQHPEDARWQLEKALARHEKAFGKRPDGLWPPEGAVSEAAIQTMMMAGLSWVATDEEILWRTLKASRSASELYRPRRIQRDGQELAIVFRDRELSDLIGFVYSRWNTREAIADFLKRLEDIYRQTKAFEHPVLVSIILDGENAWEYYPENGNPFLTGLYQALEKDDRFRCVSVSEFLQLPSAIREESLPELFAGSWIQGDLSTWIGHPEKNAAWVQLAIARQAMDILAIPDEARKSLGMAEGSDWMWWFGDTHVSQQAEEFDRIFRTHLSNSYQLSGLMVPAELHRPIRRLHSRESMQGPTGSIHPIIDGRQTFYYEWFSAGFIELTQQYSTMHRAEQRLQRFWYGFDGRGCYFRVDVRKDLLEVLDAWVLVLDFSPLFQIEITYQTGNIQADFIQNTKRLRISSGYDRFIELALLREVCVLEEGQGLFLTLLLRHHDQHIERYPDDGTFEVVSSLAEGQARAWSA